MTVTNALISRLAHKLVLDRLDRQRWSQMMRRRSFHRLRARGLDALFANRPENAIPPDWYDLEFLYKQVRKRKPRLIYEFGSGCSTLIFAQALLDNGAEGSDGRLMSFEPDADWCEVTRQGLTNGLADVVEMVHSPVIEAEFAGQLVWRYEGVPGSLSPDLMLLDGPQLTTERTAAVDVLDIEEHLRPGFMLIVDGRGKNCRFLEDNFRHQYLKRWNRVRKNTTYELHT
jgi:predicted O-methyltransferase YrrM